ncbi:MAG: hypothetical protein COA44_10215 [Arcobacter sp.]|nr:MAG: hypothetical protein COA44_10215 [Arcobacter sp.]
MPNQKILTSVGIFILLSSFLILVTLLYVIEKKGAFEAHKQYKLIAHNAEEIEKGMPILFSGFEIGQVSDLGLNEKGEVIISLSIPEHNTKWVRQGSRFILEKPLIGKAKITLNSSMNKPPLPEGAVLRMQIKDGINEAISNIQPIISELQNIVGNIHFLSNSLTDNNQSFQKALHNVENFSSKLSKAPSLLASVTGDQRSAKELDESLHNLNLVLSDLHSIIKNADDGVSEFRQDLIQPASTGIKQGNEILKDLRYKLRLMDKTVQALAESDQDINYFKDEMKVLIDEMGELSNKVNALLGKEGEENVELP